MDRNYQELLAQTMAYAVDYLSGVEERSPFPRQEDLVRMEELEEPLPQCPTDPSEVIELLHRIGSPATNAQNGGRFFGFVNGGLLPAAHAAQWMVDTWNQNSALYLMSPIASKLEEICEGWMVELLGLTGGTAAGFVTGSSNAIICALAAARDHLLRRQGYDIHELGLRGAPPVRIVLNQQVHSAVRSALSILGFGNREVEEVPVDAYGRILPEKMPPLDENTILIIQAGNVNGGSFDPIDILCDRARQAGAWVHIDGAFGLWAAASKRHRHLVKGLEKADSYSCDAHKTLNASYDCGIVLCKNREALVRAMQAEGAYLAYGEHRENMRYTTEMSRRPRAVALWAALKSLGRDGVERMIDQLCDRAQLFAEGLQRAGITVVNPVFFNQFLCKLETPQKTRRLLALVQQGGVCWCGGSVWEGEPVIRVSVCSHRTSEEDIHRSIQAFSEAAAAVNTEMAGRESVE